MDSILNHDTIAAIATGKGAAGIGIVKLSGPKALEIVAELFRSRKKNIRFQRKRLTFKSHRLYHGWIFSGDSGELIDEVLIGVMLAPHSYTTEDVVEINSHGGYQSLRSILESVLKRGARLAEPGEFTRRAWLNGRIDLCQAEAVIEIINARCKKGLHLAGMRLEGELGKKLEDVRKRVVEIFAEIEAGIEFSEEVEEVDDQETVARKIRLNVLLPIKELIRGYHAVQPQIEGLRIGVIGCPNVGKSSLVNRLICEERMIVSDQPGTTRDRVDIPIRIGDLPLILSDTAGLGNSKGSLDIASMQKTVECLKDCELILFVIDASRKISDEDESIQGLIKEKNVLLIQNKMDLVNDQNKVKIPESWPKWPIVSISARYDKEFGVLEEAIRKSAQGENFNNESSIIPNLRQCRLLDKAKEALERGAQILESDDDGWSLAACDLQEVLECIDSAVGQKIDTDILNNIFEQFCIGK